MTENVSPAASINTSTNDDSTSSPAEQSSDRHGWHTWPSRLARGWLGGTLLGALASLADALWVRSEMGGSEGALGFGQLFLSIWGVATPAVILVSIACALFALLAYPSRPASLSESVLWLRNGSSTTRLHRAIVLPLGILCA